jgi:hypothetical protein
MATWLIYYVKRSSDSRGLAGDNCQMAIQADNISQAVREASTSVGFGDTLNCVERFRGSMKDAEARILAMQDSRNEVISL